MQTFFMPDLETPPLLRKYGNAEKMAENCHSKLFALPSITIFANPALNNALESQNEGVYSNRLAKVCQPSRIQSHIYELPNIPRGSLAEYHFDSIDLSPYYVAC